jgi:hypothetical protein
MALVSPGASLPANAGAANAESVRSAMKVCVALRVGNAM